MLFIIVNTLFNSEVVPVKIFTSQTFSSAIHGNCQTFKGLTTK